MTHALKPCLFAACVLFATSCLAAAGWRRQYDVFINGERRGFASIDVDAANGRFVQQLQLDIVQLRKRIRITRQLVIQRDTDGRLQSLRVAERAGRQRQLIDGTVRAGVLRLRPSSHRAQGQELHWDDGLLLPDLELERLRAMLGTAVRDSAARAFDPWLGAWRPWRARRLEGTANGTLFEILETGRLPGESVRIELDADGQVVRQWVQRAGLLQEWRPCPADCERPVQHPLDVLQTQAVRSPFHVPQIALAGPIRYVLSRRDGQLPELAATPEQQVLVDGPRTVVTICSDCGAPVELSAAERARYLAPNAWVRSDDRRIRKFARRAGGSGSPPDQRMRKLEKLVSEHMQTVDMLGYKDAVDALESRSGDCTESAILLAAVARAQGIPTRVVAGLVYSDRFSGRRDVFAPHYWVQSWIAGRWTSYDAGVLGFDATHIALDVGDGDPAQTALRTQQLGQLVIEKMGLLPRHPTPQAAQTRALPDR